MLNSICSPEMSFKCISELEPHAYVAYVDGEKETVPLRFVYNFPPKWREHGWNKNYLYKVFWSPREDDSPSAMLKRQPEIPVFEKGSNRDDAGYHRASVELVKGTLQPVGLSCLVIFQEFILKTFKYIFGILLHCSIVYLKLDWAKNEVSCKDSNLLKFCI
jgi:hypothetical protein